MTGSSSSVSGTAAAAVQSIASMAVGDVAACLELMEKAGAWCACACTVSHIWSLCPPRSLEPTTHLTLTAYAILPEVLLRLMLNTRAIEK
jgi:hypothetical protein